MYEKIKNATEGFLAHLHLSNLVNTTKFVVTPFCLVYLLCWSCVLFIIHFKDVYFPSDSHTNDANLMLICQSTHNSAGCAIFLRFVNFVDLWVEDL